MDDELQSSLPRETCESPYRFKTSLNLDPTFVMKLEESPPQSMRCPAVARVAAPALTEFFGGPLLETLAAGFCVECCRRVWGRGGGAVGSRTRLLNNASTKKMKPDSLVNADFWDP